MRKLSKDDFIKAANKVHGSLYNYASSTYINTHTKIEIVCKKHGVFLQMPFSHLAGHGCAKCKAEKLILSKDDFVKSAKKVHGTKYDYTKTKYTCGKEDIKVKCAEHGYFTINAWYHITRGYGCEQCRQEEFAKNLFEEFIKKAREHHGRKYQYNLISHLNIENKRLKIVCKKHGVFLQSRRAHITGSGCSKCKHDSNSLSQIDFLQKAYEAHGDKYAYERTEYVRTSKKVEITCKKHGAFFQTPQLHLKGSGCPRCSGRGYSAIAIRWIEEEAKARRMKNVQHAEKGGEFCIPGTRYKVDGYHERSRTVFEFYGDSFHGNPEKFSHKSKPHPFSSKSAKELYSRTVKREQKLKDLGYRVISIWEHDYRNKINDRTR